MESGEGRSQPRRERVRIVHFADLHLGVENYGSINPVSGLSTRLEDCLAALDRPDRLAVINDLVLKMFDEIHPRLGGNELGRPEAFLRRVTDVDQPIFQIEARLVRRMDFECGVR